MNHLPIYQNTIDQLAERSKSAHYEGRHGANAYQGGCEWDVCGDRRCDADKKTLALARADLAAQLAPPATGAAASARDAAEGTCRS